MVNKMNQYNQFLLHLDEQQQIEKQRKYQLSNILKENLPIEELLKKTKYHFHCHYDNPSFTGMNSKEIEYLDKQNPNPNLFLDSTLDPYEEFKKMIENFILKDTYSLTPLRFENANGNKLKNRTNTPPLQSECLDKELKLDLEKMQKKRFEKEKEETEELLRKAVTAAAEETPSPKKAEAPPAKKF